MIYEPTRIRREAKAKADAALTEAGAVIEIGDLEKRALQRFVYEQSKEQQNIESIAAKALPNVLPDSDPSMVDDDWIAEFFARSRRVSSEEMQDLWGRILSGESNKPGSVSKRTLDFVALMDKADAELFSRLCNLSANSIGEPIVFDTKDEILKSENLKYSDLAHLESIGLIQLAGGMTSYIRQSQANRHFMDISGRLLCVDIEKKKGTETSDLTFGKIMLTRTGRELRRFVQIIPSSDLYDYCVQKWHKDKHILSSPYPQPKR